MPDLNIEDKIKDAISKRSFRENKADYIGITFIYCVILFATFLVSYFLPIVGIFVFLFVDIPLIMGYKHFIWFGPGVGENLFQAFKVSLFCGYANFVSYFKIFFTSNLKPFLLSLLMFLISNSVGMYVLSGKFPDEYQALNEIMNSGDTEALYSFMDSGNAFISNYQYVMYISLAVAVVAFVIFKISRSLLPYVCFLRLASLDGKPMTGAINHTKKVYKEKKWTYFFKSLLCNCLYLIPVGFTVLTYFLMSKNETFSSNTVTIISAMVFFVTLVPGILATELYAKSYCLMVHEIQMKEHNKMLNDAINDLEKK